MSRLVEIFFSSVNDFVFDINFSGRLFTSKESNGSWLQPCGTPALGQDGVCSFKIGLCFLPFKDLVRILRRLP